MATKKRTIHLNSSYGLPADIQGLQFIANDAESREHHGQERARIKAAQDKAAKDKREREQRVSAERDRAAEAKSALLKDELKRRYLGTGLMTREEFERQWPTLKAEYLQASIEAQERAQASLPIYANLF